jgi:D-alanyl-lipoteichoic acid acyltransferase DltB (MBOAT superfamily)
MLLISYVFYITWAWHFAFILLIITGINFFLAQKIETDEKEKKYLLWVGILINIGALVLFKYADFFIPDMLDLLHNIGVNTRALSLQIILPIGLSFYILGAISYLIDIYRRQMSATSDFFVFALFMSYFPKLVSGPIERARSFIPKLGEPYIVNNQILARGFTLIIIGTVRKVVIADSLMALIPSDVNVTPSNYSAPELFIYLLAFTFALYNDFAGYTNIGRGVSNFFGIELSRNFQHPYFSRNFTEFWNKWHITLSHWLRDYIYFPVSRVLLRRNPSRRNTLNLIVPPMTTMVVSGLWHGVSWHMLFWGSLHGIFQIVERIPTLWRPVVPPDRQPIYKQGIALMIVFFLVIMAWVPFNMNIPITIEYWRGLFDWSSISAPDFRVLIIIMPALLIDIVQHRDKNEVVFLEWPRFVQAALLAFAILAIFLVTRADAGAPFVYQGF